MKQGDTRPPMAFHARTIGGALLLQLLLAVQAFALEPITVTGQERGRFIGDGTLIWHDPSGEASLQDAVDAFNAGEFTSLGSSGSTGLAPGNFWGRFRLHNPTDSDLELRLEYIDHQLISLRAYERDSTLSGFQQLVDLSLENPFSSRPVPHHRFVVPIRVAPRGTVEVFVEYGSHQMGFVFPELRIWTPASLSVIQSKELLATSLIVGGLFVMALISFAGGLATRSASFHIYSLHALASIAVWFTVLGFTHQFLITERFHWSYMSITGALSLFTGLYFAREFLQTKHYTPRLDYLLLFLMLNSVFLLVAALAGQSTLAVISITLALLLYPCVAVVGLVRWYQGAREAAFFSIAWSFMVVGLVTQALRDLGVVEHNFVNYYWPAFASYGEMAVILVAMGIRIRDLRAEKEAAERAQMQQLEESKEMLEVQVAERTRELEAAKTAAEIEARTDTLTGVNNRRSFLAQGQRMLDRARREGLPLNLVMMDIDHFKAINDQFGHDMGDKALQVFASEVMSFIRDRDLFGRLGGEEFALMLISSPESARVTADRLRAHIQAIELQTPTGTLRFTASIGLAHLNGEDMIEPLLKRADEALYVAKDGGRDRVEIAAATPADSGEEDATADQTPGVAATSDR